MNRNLQGRHPEVVLHLESAMMRSRFRPGDMVQYIHRFHKDDPVVYRILGTTLSEDSGGLMGFYYSMQHPTQRTVFHDVAEYELEKVDEQRNPFGGSVPGNEGVLGIPNSGRADQQDRDAGHQPAAPGQAGSDPLQ